MCYWLYNRCNYTFNESKIDVIAVSGCFVFTTVYNRYDFTFVNW